MQSYQSRRQVALNVMRLVEGLARDCGKTEMVALLAKESEHLSRGELNTTICGEAKRGKSSLINAFLSEAGLCPVDAPIATNCATVIRYGDREKILVHLQQGEKFTQQEIHRSELADFVTEDGNEGNQRAVRMVEIWLNNVRLKSGLVLVDTPGIGSLNSEHSAVTYQTIPYSDALVFVGSATEPLNGEELRFARERLWRHSSRLLYVLAKKDLVDNSADRLEEDLASLADALGVEPGSIPGTAVSSKRKLRMEENRTADPEDTSGFGQFDTGIARLLASREDILLGRAYSHVMPIIAQLKLPLDVELAGLEATPAELEQIEQELKKKIARATELSLNTSSWIADLQADMQKLQTSCAARIQDDFEDLNEKLVDWLRESRYLEQPAHLGDRLSAECSDAFSVTVRYLEDEMESIVKTLATATSLMIVEADVNLSGPRQIEIRSNGKGNDKGWMWTASDVFRSSAMNTTALAGAGSLVGGIVGGIVGLLGGPMGAVAGFEAGAAVGGGVGALVGGIFGIKRGLAEKAEREAAVLRQDVGGEARKQLNAAHRSLQTGLQHLIITLRTEVQKDVMRKIVAEQTACQEAVKKLEGEKRSGQTVLEDRRRDLTARSKRLQHLGSEMTAIVRKEPEKSSVAA